MAIRPNGMTDDEYKKRMAAKPAVASPAGAYGAGTAVRNAVSNVANVGTSLARAVAKPYFDTSVGAAVGANDFGAGVVGSPAPAPPVIAKPSFNNVVGGVSSAPQRPQAPSQSMTLDQADARERAAQSARPPASPQTGAGASTVAGGVAAPVTKSIGKFGETVYSNTGSQSGAPQPTPQAGSVNAQSFGTPAIASPRVASTFGQPVTQMNDQITRPGSPNASGLTYNSAAQTGEYNNSKEDRDARKKVSGDIDTALFLARGKPGAEAVMSGLLETKAKLNAGAEGLSQEAIQNRAQRGNQFGIADLQNQGETRRTQIGADAKRAGDQLGYDATIADIARPSLKQDADGNYINISGSSSQQVLDANGNPVRGQAAAIANPRDYQREADDAVLTEIIKTKVDENGIPLPNAVALAQQDFRQIRGQGQAAPTLDAYVQAARAAGFKESDAELAAAFKKKYPQAK